MKNKILAIIIGMFLISFISAMYPGENATIEFPNIDDVNMTILSNSSSMEGFNWSKNGATITYSISADFIPQSFSVKWHNSEDVYVAESSGSSGGGGGTYNGNRRFIVSDEQFENGFTKKMYKGYVLSFKTTNQHTLTLEKIENKIAFIKIESEPIYLEFKEGEEQKISTNGVLDLYIKFNKINKYYAEIEIKKINEVEEIEDEIPEKETDEETPEEKKYYRWLFMILGIVILIIMILSYRVKKKKIK